MNYSQVSQAYKQVDICSAVASATPHELISLLFGGALKQIAIAKGAIEREDTALKGESTSKAIAILGELEGALKDRETNEISGNLSRLYDYMIRTLASATVASDIDKLSEVSGLIVEIKEAWDQIGDKVEDTKPSA